MDPDRRLCERMRIHCARVGWYGPEMEINVDRSEPWPRNPCMTFPIHLRLTTSRSAQTERELGFKLPPLLRALYQQLGNGGFGPGYGLVGASGGHIAHQARNTSSSTRIFVTRL